METNKAGRSLGSSLLVPCVQELVANNSLNSIPPRYIRTDDPDHLSVVSYDLELAVPIIDMEKLLCRDPIHSELELNKLDSACRHWGFFQLINHGVSGTLIEKVKKETEKFFNMPMEEKKKFCQREGELEGFGQAFIVSEEQKLDWADIFFLFTLPPSFRTPHLFSMLPLPFRDSIEVYATEVRNIAMKTIENMAKALNMKAEDMKIFEQGMQSMRMNYYPPCPQPEQVVALAPHSDATGLTILLQFNELDGLQIKKDGKWVPVKPLPNAFVVNIGDILEIVTNGTYRSSVHRVMVNSAKERQSIATFYNPNTDGEMGPAPSLITDKTPAKFITLPVKEFLKGLFARELIGNTYLDVMRIQNDHTSKIARD